ncbi:MAG: TlpA family protein disulfide reductase [Gemmataceae bacterium]|nr:TlpA family protein disulfide reductase [Gemmataceae bacterium]
MHRQYTKDGLVVLSVSVDELKIDGEETGAKAVVEKFLRERGATFPNLLLDEPQEVWHKKLRVISVPTVFVFNRSGKWVQFKAEDETLKKDKGDNKGPDGRPYYKYVEVEALVQKLLKEKK